MCMDVRRISAAEWRLARDLRLEALRDPDADIAFLETHAHAAGQPDEFWRDRARRAASGRDAAQFAAITGDAWVGTVTALVQKPGSADRSGAKLRRPRVTVVGVYVRPDRRGRGTIDRLLQAAVDWTRQQGIRQLALEVHRDNLRAQGAYRRAGFHPSGVAFLGPIGPEIEMVRFV